MDEKLKCDGCGMPSEVASQYGMQLELQKGGRVLCPVCCKIIPILDEDLRNNITKRSKDFASYIDSSAAMFEISTEAVLFATGEIFMESINQISKRDKDLAIKSIDAFTEDLKKIADKLKESKSEEVRI